MRQRRERSTRAPRSAITSSSNTHTHTLFASFPTNSRTKVRGVRAGTRSPITRFTPRRAPPEPSASRSLRKSRPEKHRAAPETQNLATRKKKNHINPSRLSAGTKHGAHRGTRSGRKPIRKCVRAWGLFSFPESNQSEMPRLPRAAWREHNSALTAGKPELELYTRNMDPHGDL